MGAASFYPGNYFNKGCYMEISRTRTVKVPPELLRFLKENFLLTPQPDGKFHGILTPVDRTVYTKLVKVIENAGGVWNRKAQAHIFQSDPREALGLIFEAGTIEITKVSDGFYPTPVEIGSQMLTLAFLQARMRVLEPSAGEGAIAALITPHVPLENLVLVEINPTRCAVLRQHYQNVHEADFLTLTPADLGHFDRIYMNPQFELMADVDHVRHAYDFLLPGGMLAGIMSPGPFQRNDVRKAKDFRVWFESVKGKVRDLPPGAFKESGTAIQTKMILIQK